MKYRIKLYPLLLLLFTFYACKEDDATPVYKVPPELSKEAADVAVKWGNMTLYTVRFSAFNSPTYTSRSLGYLGLAMYESVINGDSTHQSMSGQLTGIELPKPDSGKSYYWLLSLNEAQHTLLKLLYPVPANSHRFIHDKIDSLSMAIYSETAKNIDPETINRSVKFGETIARALYEWSLSDGGDKGYLRNFEPSFVFPSGDSYWIPPTVGQTVSKYPLHPYWGDNRPFVNANKSIPIPDIVPFSTDPSSAYYKLYKDVYDKDHTLTLEEKEIAAWWGDDPTETFSPPGHSYYIATVAIRKSNANLVKACETYARVGLAVADAFIDCWKVKYIYFNERPSSYIRKYIDHYWTQFWPEPPFPAFPSGHAIHAAASATVLTDLFGESFSFTDSCHAGHRRYDYERFLDLTYPARNFSSFWEAANESAYSRFLGGIHTKQDNDVAQQMGKKLGENVNALQWHK